jgi:hypothetical protein
MGILAFLSGHGIKPLPVAANDQYINNEITTTTSFEEEVDIFFNTLAAG